MKAQISVRWCIVTTLFVACMSCAPNRESSVIETAEVDDLYSRVIRAMENGSLSTAIKREEFLRFFDGHQVLNLNERQGYYPHIEPNFADSENYVVTLKTNGKDIEWSWVLYAEFPHDWVSAKRLQLFINEF